MKRWLYGKLVLGSLAAVLLAGGCSALAAASVELTVIEQQGIARQTYALEYGEGVPARAKPAAALQIEESE